MMDMQIIIVTNIFSALKKYLLNLKALPVISGTWTNVVAVGAVQWSAVWDIYNGDLPPFYDQLCSLHFHYALGGSKCIQVYIIEIMSLFIMVSQLKCINLQRSYYINSWLVNVNR